MKTLQALLLTGEQGIKQNRNLNEQSATKLEQLGRMLDRGEQLTVHFTTGMGLSERGFPLRLPAIAIPTLRVMQRLNELGVANCHYTLYQARDFLIESQCLDRSQAIRISNHMQGYLHEYIKRRFGRLEKNVEFQFDKKIDSDELEEVKTFLRDTELPEMQKIVTYATSKGRDSDSAYEYAAANIISNQYVGKVCHIVMGGEKERPFFRLGQTYEDVTDHETKSIPLIQSTGYIPPYYPQGDEESHFDSRGNLISRTDVTLNKYLAYDISLL